MNDSRVGGVKSGETITDDSRPGTQMQSSKHTDIASAAIESKGGAPSAAANTKSDLRANSLGRVPESTFVQDL